MPQFQYVPYRNPEANSIAELLLRKGDIAARQAEQVGAIQAHAAQQSGQAMAGAVANLGQIAAAVPGQLQQQRMNALTEQNVRGQIADRTSLANERDVKTQALTREQRGLDTLAEVIKANVNPETGEVDHAAVARGVTQAGFPDLAQHYTDGIEKTATSRLAFQESTRKAAVAKTHYVGELALSALAAINRDPTNLMAARDAVMGHVAAGAATGVIAEAEGRDFLTKMAQANPEQLKGVLQYFVEQAPELVKSEAARKKTEADTAKVEADTAKTNAEITGTLPLNPAQAETARHNAAVEAIEKQNSGRAAAAQQETARHNRETEKAANPLAALTGGSASGGGPAQQGVTGDAFLKTLPPNVANEVKAYAEGRRPFPAGFALKSPYFQSMIQMVGQYDPTFDAVNYNSRAKTRNDFTSGKSAQTINALNTVTQHLDRLSTAADGLNNSWSPTYNSIANFVSKQTGNKAVTNFQTVKTAVVDELVRVWRQAGGSEHDIKTWSASLDAANSPEQLHGAISEMGQLIGGKLSALESQFQQGMGTAADVPVATAASRQVLTRLEQKAGRPQETASAAGRMRVIGPNGQTGTVPEGTALPPGWKKQ